MSVLATGMGDPHSQARLDTLGVLGRALGPTAVVPSSGGGATEGGPLSTILDAIKGWFGGGESKTDTEERLKDLINPFPIGPSQSGAGGGGGNRCGPAPEFENEEFWKAVHWADRNCSPEWKGFFPDSLRWHIDQSYNSSLDRWCIEVHCADPLVLDRMDVWDMYSHPVVYVP